MIMIDLDDPQVHERLDAAGMRHRIRELPQQCLKAWQQAMSLELPPDYSNVDKVVVLGMGGSAIGGDLLSSLIMEEAKLPVFVHRDYRLPHFVDASTLVIASSYSGDTEETLAAFAEALDTPAKKLAVTTGGRLREMAEPHGLPVFSINYSSQPRAALAHSLFALIGICDRLGIVNGMSEHVANTVRVLEDLQRGIEDSVPVSLNAAKQLAARLHGHQVIVYGAGVVSPVARRWKTQINENSKAWAFYEVFPELNHNAVVGYQFPKELLQRTFVILLRSGQLHPRTLLRYDVTAEMLGQAGIEYEVVDGSGDSALSQMMSLVLFGDWVSYYLALLYDTDPTPVRAIDYLKERLSQAQGRQTTD